MGEIQREKQKILTQAMEEANTIREQAQNLGYEAGFKEGTEKGYEKAIRDAQEEAEEIKNKAKELIVQSEEYIEEYLEENRKNIIQLAATMAESIVHETIDTSSEKLLLLIKPILQQFNKGKNIIITCDPENEDYLKSRLEELKSINNDVNFVVLKDSSLEKNGCIIENEQQVLDLQISKQIHNILKDIKDME
nr:FliH/SctL family protein [Wansuia hejianensis]